MAAKPTSAMEGAHWMRYLEEPEQNTNERTDKECLRHPFHSSPLKLETLQNLSFEILLPTFQYLFLDFFGEDREDYVFISLPKPNWHELEFDGATPAEARKFQLLCSTLDELRTGSKVAAAAAEALYGCPSFIFTVKWNDYSSCLDECPLSGIRTLERFIRHLRVDIPDVKHYVGGGIGGRGISVADWVDLDGKDTIQVSSFDSMTAQLRPLWELLLKNSKLESIRLCIEPAKKATWKDVSSVETRHLLPTIFRLQAKDVYVRVFYSTWEKNYWQDSEWSACSTEGGGPSEAPIRVLHNLTQGFLYDRFLQRNDCCLRLCVKERLAVLFLLDRAHNSGSEYGLPISERWKWYQYAAFRLLATERLRELWSRLKPAQKTAFGSEPLGLQSDQSWELSRGSNWIGLPPYTRA